MRGMSEWRAIDGSMVATWWGHNLVVGEDHGTSRDGRSWHFGTRDGGVLQIRGHAPSVGVATAEAESYMWENYACSIGLGDGRMMDIVVGTDTLYGTIAANPRNERFEVECQLPHGPRGQVIAVSSILLQAQRFFGLVQSGTVSTSWMAQTMREAGEMLAPIARMHPNGVVVKRFLEEAAKAASAFIASGSPKSARFNISDGTVAVLGERIGDARFDAEQLVITPDPVIMGSRRWELLAWAFGLRPEPPKPDPGISIDDVVDAPERIV